jgi:hypothetical protein
MPGWAQTHKGSFLLGFPDLCRTIVPPPKLIAPIPYPSIAFAKKCKMPTISPNVFMKGKQGHKMLSMVPSCLGDCPGFIGGIISGKIMGKVLHLLGSFCTMTNFFPAMHQFCLIGVNGLPPNGPGISLTPSQNKVKINK